MPVMRTELNKSSFYRKILAYEATWRQEIHRRRVGWQRFRVLTVTTNPQRIREMIAACQQLKQGRGLFLFTDVQAVKNHPDLLSVRWQTAREGETSDLFC
jgi:hypothetical protein